MTNEEDPTPERIDAAFERVKQLLKEHNGTIERYPPEGGRVTISSNQIQIAEELWEADKLDDWPRILVSPSLCDFIKIVESV